MIIIHTLKLKILDIADCTTYYIRYSFNEVYCDYKIIVQPWQL